MDFINIHGRPLSVSPAGTPTPARKARPIGSVFHKGWRVVGYPPGAIRRASEEHASSPEARHRPFDEEAWCRANKPKSVRSKPYELASAAALCASMAERAGWDRVRVVEVAKGSAS